MNKKGKDSKWHWVPTMRVVRGACGVKLPSILEERNAAYGDPQAGSVCERCAIAREGG